MGWEYHDRKRKADGRFSATERTRRVGFRVDDITLGIMRGRAYARRQSVTQYLIDLVHADKVSGKCAPTGENNGSACQGPP